MARKTVAEAERERARAALDARLKRYAKVAKDFGEWSPAAEVLEEVQAQPTIFPQFDQSTRVGGWPTSRAALVHGKSSHGKSAFCLGLGKSFLLGGHFFGYVDAEMTTPESWTKKLMGETAGWPTFVAMRPKNYEQVVKGVRSLVNRVAKGRESGELEADTSALVVIDSIRKLVPKDLLDKLLKGGAGFDGASGRAAMMKAALNSQWLDELTPLLYHTRTSLIFIARETENPNRKPWESEYKVGGGSALLYDSSLAIRVELSGRVKEGGKGEDDAGRVVGERHRVAIHKTKVAAKDGKRSESYFHTSNGALTPEGFDRPRDVLEMSVDSGLVEKKGSWYSYGEERLGQGENQAVVRLHEQPDLCEKIETELRELWVNRAA